MRSVFILPLAILGMAARLRAQVPPASTTGSTLIKAARLLDVVAGVYASDRRRGQFDRAR